MKYQSISLGPLAHAGIHKAVFLVKLEIEEMVKTKFNPGDPVETYESADSGISPLMLIPRTTQ